MEQLLHNYDVVIDTVGGGTHRKSFAVLKEDGVVVSLVEELNTHLMEQYGVKAELIYADVNTSSLSQLARLADEGAIKVHIAKTFAIEDAKQSLEYQQYGHPLGKVVIINTI